jgi:hypothetical protein
VIATTAPLTGGGDLTVTGEQASALAELTAASGRQSTTA